MTVLNDGLAAELRRHAYERYLLSLFAPAARRPALWAILCCDLELSRIPELVSQPVLGQMRLAWWRDAVTKALARGESGGNPVLQGLSAADAAGLLDRAALEALIDGHERLLMRDGEAPLARLADDAGTIGVALANLRLRALGLELQDHAEPARCLGVAWEILRRLRALPRAAAIGQVMIPGDLVLAVPADPAEPAANRAALRQVTAHLAAGLERQSRLARGRGAPRAALPVFGENVVTARFLARLRRCGGEIADPRLARPDGLLPAALLRAWVLRTF